MRSRISLALIAVFLLALTGCGSDDSGGKNNITGTGGGGGGGSGGGGGGGGGGTSGFTATVDGGAWTAASGSIVAREDVSPSPPGTFTISGEMVAGLTNVTIIQLTLYNIKGTGTYPVGVTPTIFGGAGMVTSSTGTSATVYSTPNSGAAGTVTITTLTATRIAGTSRSSPTDSSVRLALPP